MQRLIRDRILGPKLTTYDSACEELGGVPWRTFGQTEKWFVGDQVDAPPPPVPQDGIDSAELVIGRGLSRSTWLWIGGGAAIGGAILIAVALAAGGSAPAPGATAPAVTARAASAPAATAPTSASPTSAPVAAGPVITSSSAMSNASAVKPAARTPQPAIHRADASVRALFVGSPARASATGSLRKRVGRLARAR
jgi:hypothetical protein